MSKYFKEKPDGNKAAKPVYRAGRVPDWAYTQNTLIPNEAKKNEVYKGLTSDYSAVIVDTSKGMMKKEKLGDEKDSET
jgi:hypothetical protein